MAKWVRSVSENGVVDWRLTGTMFSVSHDKHADLPWDVLEGSIWLCATRFVAQGKKLAERLAKE